MSESSNSGALQPAAQCGCRIPAVLRVSHTEKNPFRRFLCCSNVKGDCGMWKWVDPELSPYYKTTVLRLKAMAEDGEAGDGNSDGLCFAKSNDGESICVDEVKTNLRKLENAVKNLEWKIRALVVLCVACVMVVYFA
ncbi:uncharacterized protein LOC131023511 [Salvia miltiorrhiza]|uniref:uncharacterized protein LOC130991040 n=1 Tax=Salvia miltiorrhiza TaxID=226208 RepID=UPI0025ACA86D|nr:uncharacterized protein LOC130991040 [Salvia miltiorrhiza]XP_057809037.1 uncharacterized protein LOC131023511 [Salvia miltiorrhiza]